MDRTDDDAVIGAEECRHCLGSGRDPNGSGPCPDCDGSGEQPDDLPDGTAEDDEDED